MLKIGITGGIGSGKSTISKIFEIIGIPVFYSDDVAKSLMHTDRTLAEGIKELFGAGSYSGGQLNRKYLADIVFNDPYKLKQLNALVHPAVFRAFDVWAPKQNAAPYILKEAALLFESGSYLSCDKNILIMAPEQLKIDRVVQRTGFSEDEVKLRMNRQFNEKQGLKLADFVIINDEQHLIIPQVLELHEQFLRL